MGAIPSNSVNVGALIASLGLDTTAFQAGIAGANASMKGVSAKMTALGTKMQMIGKKMTMGLTLPIIAMGVAAIKSQKDFEASMSKIIGLVGVATDQVKDWEKAILRLGPAVGKGPEELADAMFFIASAGIRGAEALDVLEMSAKASASGLGETKVVADLVTSAMNAYGSANLNATMATDILTAAVREGKAEASELAGAMGMVLPIASAFGVSFDQVGAAFAAMTRTGTNARVAATQLKAILSSMASPTQQAESALEKYGTSSAKFRKIVEEQGLIDALLHLREATNGNKVAMAEIFPNIRGLMGVLDLLGANAEENIKIFDSLTNATGSLDAAFEAASETTQFKWDQAVSQIKTTFTKFGEVLKNSIIPVIENITEKVREITEKFDALNSAEKENIIRMLALAAAAGPVLMIFGKLIKLIVANPYVALAAAVALLVIGIVKLVKASKEQNIVLGAVDTAYKKINDQILDEQSNIQALINVAKDENAMLVTRETAIKKLNKLMPDYNGYLEKETGHLKANETALDNYLKKLEKKITVLIFEEELIQGKKDLRKAEKELLAAELDRASRGPKNQADMINMALRVEEAKGSVEGYTKAIGNLKTEMAGLGILDLTSVKVRKKAKVAPTISTVTPTANGPDDDMSSAFQWLNKETAKESQVSMDALSDYWSKTRNKMFAVSFATRRASAMAMQAGVDKEQSLEQLSYAQTIARLEQQAIDEPALRNQIDAQIEAEHAAHVKRMEDIDTASDTKIFKGKVKTAQAWIQNVAAAIGAISTLIESQKQRELSSAGDNADKREEIEKKFFKKQKAMSIAMALVNGALAITNMIANVPGSVLNPATWVGIGIAAASTIAQVAMIASQSFADGGIISGPTVGLMGEYPGARSNPEVVAPLSKLQGMLSGGGGGGNFEVIETDIRGADIHLVLQRYNNTLTRSGK